MCLNSLPVFRDSHMLSKPVFTTFSPTSAPAMTMATYTLERWRFGKGVELVRLRSEIGRSRVFLSLGEPAGFAVRGHESSRTDIAVL